MTRSQKTLELGAEVPEDEEKKEHASSGMFGERSYSA